MDDVLILKRPAPVGIDEIRRLVAPLLRQHGAVKAYLFGSYARGSADGWSDIDLLVVMPTENAFVERPLALKDVLDALPVAVDLIVYTPEEFERGLHRGIGVFDAIDRDGVSIL